MWNCGSMGIRVGLDSALCAVRFLVGIGYDSYGSCVEEYEENVRGIESENMMNLFGDLYTIRVCVYMPKSVDKSRPSILIVHGVCASGMHDNRIVQLAKSFASAGFIVLVPRLLPFEQCVIDETCIQAISISTQVLSRNEKLCPSGRLSYSAACISAGMLLMALSSSESQQFSRAFLLIGCYANVNTVFDYAMSPEQFDNYGRNVLFYSYRHLIWKDRPHLSLILKAAIDVNHYESQNISPSIENSLQNSRDRLNSLLSEYKVDAKIYWMLDNDSEYRMQCVNQVKSLAFEDIVQRVSPIYILDQLSQHVAICMIHGVGDSVIPVSESVSLLDSISCKSLAKSELVITSLIDHGTKRKFGLAFVFEVLKLFKLLFIFFLWSLH